MLRLRHELNVNSELISPRSIGPNSSNSISFVPFINERDSLGRLIGISPRRYDLKRDLMPRGGGSKKQLLSKIYQDSKTQESIHTESKMEELESPSGMEFWVTKRHAFSSNVFNRGQKRYCQGLREVK